LSGRCLRIARAIACGGIASALLAAGGCGRRAGPSPNLLLVTLDTTRADRLGCYGVARAETPHLDRLAREGALFEQAIAVAPLTLPSHVSLLTGRYPPAHHVRLNGEFRASEEETLLAEHLAVRGYATAAAVGAFVVSAEFGLGQGFATFDEPAGDPFRESGARGLVLREIAERPAAEVTDAALRLLDNGLPEPFFLWLHYFDPHGDYRPPPPFADRFADRPYDGEIAYVDSQLGRVLDALERDGRLDRTLVAVTADHGESLGEHGELTHGLFVYDATLRVPLLLRLPGQVRAGLRSERVVSGVDLAPTLLELLGQPPLAGIDGVSFAPACRGDAMAPRAPVYAEAELPLRSYGWAGLQALRDHRNKFVRAPVPELYDLGADPGETQNLGPGEPGDLARWSERLAALERGWPEAPETAHALDATARAKLEALGYVSGGPSPPARAERPDPKRLVQLHNLLVDAWRLVAAGAFPQALELAETALGADADNPQALELYGTLACHLDRCDEGLPRLAAAARLAPGSYQTQHNLANALHLAGRLPEAAAAFRVGLSLRPFEAGGHFALGNVLFAMGDATGALASYREAARRGLDAPSFHAAFGVALSAAGETVAARAALERAVAGDPALADAWVELGALEEREGDPFAARERYARALAAAPSHAGALFHDVRACIRLGLLDEALARARGLLDAHPEQSAGRFLEAQVLLARGENAAARRALERFLAEPAADPRLAASARELLGRLE
jgi:arylsulfatase A-like enzyme/tetratricopeptide (TPR) repeat protein